MKARILSCAALLLVLFSFALAQHKPNHVVRVTSAEAKAHLLHHVEPVYPQMARIAHIEGDVVVQVLIDENGDTGNARVVSGHPILAQSAVDAVKQWKYKPFTVNGKLVTVETTVTVKFHN